MKVMILAARRKGITLRQMHRHAGEVHAPLALSAPDADAFAHYQQTHVTDGAYGELAPGPFDIVAEDTFVSPEAFNRIGQSEYFREKIAPDEARFGDLSSRIFFFVQEHLVRDIWRADTLKAVFLLKKKSNVEDSAFLESWQALDRVLSPAIKGAVRNMPVQAPPGMPEVFHSPPLFDGAMVLWAQAENAAEEFHRYWVELKALAEIDAERSLYVIGSECVIIP